MKKKITKICLEVKILAFLESIEPSCASNKVFEARSCRKFLGFLLHHGPVDGDVISDDMGPLYQRLFKFMERGLSVNLYILSILLSIFLSLSLLSFASLRVPFVFVVDFLSRSMRSLITDRPPRRFVSQTAPYVIIFVYCRKCRACP